MAVIEAIKGLVAINGRANLTEEETWWSSGWLKAFARKVGFTLFIQFRLIFSRKYASLLVLYKDDIPAIVKAEKGYIEEALSRWPAHTESKSA